LIFFAINHKRVRATRFFFLYYFFFISKSVRTAQFFFWQFW